MIVLEEGSPRQPIRALSFSPDGGQLVACSNGPAVWLWDLDARRGRALAPVQRWCRVLFSPSGEVVVADAGSVRILGTGGEERRRIRAAGGAVDQMSLSPDGRLLALAQLCAPKWVYSVLDLREGKKVVSWSWEGMKVGDGLAFSANGKTLAVARSSTVSGGRNHFIELHSTADLLVRRVIVGHSAQALDLAFHPGGRALAAACGRQLWVWDPANGEALATYRSDDRHFKAVAFSPDGRLLAAASHDETVRCFQTQGWGECEGYNWGIGPVVALAFSADGMRAAAGSKTGRIVVWDVDR